MAIVKETGSGNNPAANSYVDAAYFTDYANARGLTLPTNIDPLLILAMDYLRQFEWQGQRANDDQPLAWPRSGVVIHGDAFPSNAIPEALKDAQAQLALYADKQDLMPMSKNSQYVTQKKVGPISLQYAEPERVRGSAGLNQPVFPKVQALLDGLVESGGAFGEIGKLRSVRV